MAENMIQLTSEICEQVPDYHVFPGVAEVQAEIEELREAYPDRVRVETIGTSQEGADIEMVTVGDLSDAPGRSMLLKGMVHPNEAICTLTTGFLSKRFAADPDLLPKLGYRRARMIPLADQDGYALQGWTNKLFTPKSYLKGFYRSPGNRQVDHGYPLHYKDVHIEGLPESLAVAKVIEEANPDYMVALHNGALGDPYLYIDDQGPEAASILSAWFAHCGLRPSTGPIETPMVTMWAPGMFERWSIAKRYEYLRKQDRRLEDTLVYAASSGDFLSQVNPNAWHLMPETSYFDCAILNDDRLSGRDLSSAVLEGISRRMVLQDTIQQALMELATDRSLKTHPLYLATASNLAVVNNFLALKKDISYPDKEITVGQAFEMTHIGSFYALAQIGQIAQLAFIAGDNSLGTDLHTVINKHYGELEEAGGKLEVTPLRDLAAAQIGFVLIGAMLASGRTN